MYQTIDEQERGGGETRRPQQDQTKTAKRRRNRRQCLLQPKFKPNPSISLPTLTSNPQLHKNSPIALTTRSLPRQISQIHLESRHVFEAQLMIEWIPSGRSLEENIEPFAMS